MTGARGERGLSYAILTVFTVLALFPMGAILWQAFQVGPHGIDPSTFARAWRLGHFGTYMRNSLIVAVVVVTVASVFSIMAGYALGTMRFLGERALFYVFVFGLMIPTEAVVVPLFFDLRSMGLTDTLPGLMLPQIAQSLAFGTFWMRAYFRSAPRSLVEAARMDGASSWTVLWRVLVPVGRPAILTMVVLLFMWTWNEFLLALVLVSANESLRTAPLGLSVFQGPHTTDFPLLSAAALIVALPVVVVYVLLQRHFIAGMLSGALKE
ncbi:MAG TPA: carbohydrate ABC transporter permease [Streptosporangiaceae bacterium]|jgi:raffinose/stachyose/melibiose transport system permease protein